MYQVCLQQLGISHHRIWAQRHLMTLTHYKIVKTSQASSVAAINGWATLNNLMGKNVDSKSFHIFYLSSLNLIFFQLWEWFHNKTKFKVKHMVGIRTLDHHSMTAQPRYETIWQASRLPVAQKAWPFLGTVYFLFRGKASNLLHYR